MQPLDNAFDAIVVDDPAPEQVAQVGAQRVHRTLVGVQRQREVAASRIQPERLVEARPELGGFALQPAGELVVSPGGPRHLRESELRVEDIALDFRGRDRGSASLPSEKRCESPESFHDWFASPRGVRRRYSTKPSPSRSP